MITILTVTGIASAMMFMFFFVLPAIDRSKTKPMVRMPASQPGRRSATTAH